MRRVSYNLLDTSIITISNSLYSVTVRFIFGTYILFRLCTVLVRSCKRIRQRILVTSVALCACVCRRGRDRGYHRRRGGCDRHHPAALDDWPRHPLQSPQGARALQPASPGLHATHHTATHPQFCPLTHPPTHTNTQSHTHSFSLSSTRSFVASLRSETRLDLVTFLELYIRRCSEWRYIVIVGFVISYFIIEL